MNRRAAARREQTAAGIRGSFFNQYGVALPRSTNDVPDFVQAIRARIEAGPEFGYLAGGTSSLSGRSGTVISGGGGGRGAEEEGEDHLHAAAAPGVRAATPETAARPASRNLDHVGEHLQGGGSSSASTSSQAMSMAASSQPAHGAPGGAAPVFRGTTTTGEEDLTATTSAGAGPREEGGEMQLEFVSPRESPTGGAAGHNPPGAGSGADNAVTSTLLGPTAGANADQAQEFLAHLVSSGLQSQEVAELLAEEARLAAAHAWAASSSASSASSVAPSGAVSPEGDAAVALPSPSYEGSPVTIPAQHHNGRLRETLVELQGRLSRFPHHVARIQQSITELEHDAAGGVDQQPQQRGVGDTERTTFSTAASAQVVEDGSPTIAWDRRRRRESQLVTNRPATTGGTSTGSGAYTLPIPAVAPLSAPAATVEPDLIARPVSAPGSLEVGHDLCIVCQTNPRNASFVHGTTAHIACCYQCALETRRRNRNCPICRQRIELVVQNFQS
mmetsp:Transcript_5850/g.14551  ORF Transcript_5850/g.14551 Transcript_5850/m.14551 type:complete len:502 (+) Transcript_5850:120-1625(+)